MFVFQHLHHLGRAFGFHPARNDRTGVNCEPPETRVRVKSGRPGTVAAGTVLGGCEGKALGVVS